MQNPMPGKKSEKNYIDRLKSENKFEQTDE